MTTVTATQTTDTNATAVWAVLAHADLLPQVSDMTVEVTDDPGHALQVGDTFSQKVRVLGVPLATEWKVTAAEPTRLMRVEGTGPMGAHATIQHTLVETGTGCTLTLDVEYEVPAGVLGEAVDHLLVERRAKRDAQTIVENIIDLAGSRAVAGAPEGA